EDESIRKGIENLASGKDFENLFESAKSRAIADWLVGMNLSRLYSCLYNQNYSVGRVQTPTLSMIVERDSEITGFIKAPYYVVE
ncbi:DNA topoisomerase, partial [Streptococcus pyogenes]